ncbi:unnamed protein product [Bursaphelenchus xylophilus]|uniref:(pine wood nematode) hypothetical protein n=1 Tax=Bursaphelenchus xylophilus TaxID=6326 RepID=A0A1I7STC4_BURXY|nr:unnamed protein product [Bursaphelenchus xylophilus]CAG9108573.1 unnamed protein product [Bursaphelenchus xylophilus]
MHRLFRALSTGLSATGRDSVGHQPTVQETLRSGSAPDSTGMRPPVSSESLKRTSDSDVVARWNIPMSDTVYQIEFEHGTTTGKRIVRVNGREVVRHDWLFKLVGREVFEINGVRCVINIEAIGIFAYEYSITVNGKTYEKFKEEQNKSLKMWHVRLNENDIRVVLEKDSMEVWVNGDKVNTTGIFVDDGTETHFEIGSNVAFIKTESSGRRAKGIVYKLYVNGDLIEAIN